MDYTYGFKVGDLITAYHKGIHKIVEIKRRFYTHPNEIPSILRESVNIGDEFMSVDSILKRVNENILKSTR